MVSRGSGRPRSTQKDWVGVDEAGRGDEGLARGPLRSVRPGEVLLWDWGSSSCARDLVGGDCREGPGLGEAVRDLARREEVSIASGEGPIRMHSEPPYVGGDPEMWHLEVNPGVEEGRFNLWRDLRAMYTRCVAVDDHHGINEYFLFERLQVRWDESVQAR